ncbi:cyclic AMP-dependent transcription factor ATF-7 [Colletes gigas]|uniref:cyclic AMP-dependent transcription factor ATF-7 n=1 Tax=Colletes gigas TaxID=935657 RepID=UPI001C9B1505|nr:cyclic AMP-dependent transcription factor ATF-7 [Colletes gigas]
MADSEKPFTCSSPGCNMNFTNEDQLSVHKKKHDMMLNLGNGSKNVGFMADQTPTPTRFIRNCEEVGLFQDLQNVNPFEETFRRAVESGNTGTLTVPEAGITDDTLHTPHIFPHITDVLPTGNQILPENSIQECTSSISITENSTDERTTVDTEVCSSMKLSVSNKQDLTKDKLTTEKTETLTENIIHQVTSTPIIPKILQERPTPQLSINGEEVQLLLKTSDGKLMQLSAIPISGSSNANTVQPPKHPTVVIKTEPPLQYTTKGDFEKSDSMLSLAKMKLKQVLTKSTDLKNLITEDSSGRNEFSNSKKQNRGKTMEEQIKKKDILERNRASSMRARAKRKAWIQQLERTVANVNETNVALQMEIKVLRAEVAKLKTLLLAHKDCPVTKAMQKGSSIVLGPKVISLNSDLMANPTTPMGILMKRPTSYSSAEASVVPKKKLCMAPLKNPIIFPKVDSNTSISFSNATFIKTMPAIKLMGVNQLLTETKEAKQILIMQNPRRKIVKSTKQIIQINPNYETDLGDTKSAGT